MMPAPVPPHVKVKVRRARQPRNPQLSVARRNERERNRVKMVNNGFALLREHLPIEYLQACNESGPDTPEPGNKPGAKAKKFSKVETLRAAIQHIKMLEELMRQSEPAFESINIVRPGSGASQLAAAYDDEPLSIGAPLSCASSSSNTHQPAAHLYSPQPEQFVKLEPQQQQQQQQQQRQHAAGLASPAGHHSQGANTQYAAHARQRHAHAARQAAGALAHQHQEQSHTHLWIQQHQSSFMQQQQANWYADQQQQVESKGNWQFVQQTAEPAASQQAQQQMQPQIHYQLEQQHEQHQHEHQQHEQQQHEQHQHQQQQQQQQQLQLQQLQLQQHNPSQLDSPPIWFANSPSGSSVQQSPASSQPVASPFGQHQQHQISLYGQ